MTFTIIAALLAVLIVYVLIGLAVGRRTRDVADLLPLIEGRQASVRDSSEFSTATVATTISLATVIMALFELSQYLGLWLMWTVATTAMGLLVVRLFAGKIWLRMSVYDHRPTLFEFLGTEFNSRVLLRIGAICTSLGFLGAFAVELMVGSKFFAGLIPGAPAWAVVAVLCMASFLYTAAGGFRAVIVTDRVQMISIWLLLVCLPAFYIYYILTHGGFSEGLKRMPPQILNLSFSKDVLSFLVGILVINVPTFISDMSVWQRIAGSEKGKTVATGLGRSAFGAGITWAILTLLACFVFMIISPTEGVNPLVTLVGVIGSSGGVFTSAVLFVTVVGLYGAMLSVASTQLVAVSHLLYTDVFLRSRAGYVRDDARSRNELKISRAILLLAAVISTLVVQGLSHIGFSIADLVFAIYGAQLGLCPLVLAALLWDRTRLRKLSAWAVIAVSAGFVAGWAAAVYGRLTHDTDLVFLAPVFSLVSSLLFLGIGIISSRAGANVNWILIKSVIKARRAGLYRFRPPKGPVRLVCLKEKCARCCKVIGTPVVKPEEAENIGLDSIIKNFRGDMFIKSDDCACILLKGGLCSIYPHRPKGCREYPWYNIDGRLYYDSGCPGVQYDKDERPNVEDIQPFDGFFSNTPKFIIRLIKKICVGG
ncbi:MAG: YkgJ family cysteine cluster protein [Sedimentisphaerales bacterium]|nr:YkgJ family cysteine cluster protein [Sedimentisphaerales bacterium]